MTDHNTHLDDLDNWTDLTSLIEHVDARPDWMDRELWPKRCAPSACSHQPIGGTWRPAHGRGPCHVDECVMSVMLLMLAVGDLANDRWHRSHPTRGRIAHHVDRRGWQAVFRHHQFHYRDSYRRVNDLNITARYAVGLPLVASQLVAGTLVRRLAADNYPPNVVAVAEDIHAVLAELEATSLHRRLLPSCLHLARALPDLQQPHHPAGLPELATLGTGNADTFDRKRVRLIRSHVNSHIAATPEFQAAAHAIADYDERTTSRKAPSQPSHLGIHASTESPNVTHDDGHRLDEGAV